MAKEEIQITQIIWLFDFFFTSNLRRIFGFEKLKILLIFIVHSVIFHSFKSAPHCVTQQVFEANSQAENDSNVRIRSTPLKIDPITDSNHLKLSPIPYCPVVLELSYPNYLSLLKNHSKKTWYRTILLFKKKSCSSWHHKQIQSKH